MAFDLFDREVPSMGLLVFCAFTPPGVNAGLTEETHTRMALS
jgi:hypothetical protein